ncbi:MAG: helix-turn-helix transcriptional regulator [Eubacteriales bacterium]|nr:helix-turn-helix transcriptional regulator [Eubacteriales bacterium]
MEKNTFLLYDNLVYALHSAASFQEVKRELFSYMKMLIPYQYASILLIDNDPENRSSDLQISEIYCEPQRFKNAELSYVQRIEQNPSEWRIFANESIAVRKSGLLSEEDRRHSALFRSCYQGFHVLDSLQMSVVYKHCFIGMITLYRTREAGSFTDEDAALLKTLGKHLGRVFYEKCGKSDRNLPVQHALEEIRERVHLTPKETEILTKIFLTKSNQDICTELVITEHTLQKHLQNIYRKLNISSKWELFHYLVA